jgi:hypothetical protein
MLPLLTRRVGRCAALLVAALAAPVSAEEATPVAKQKLLPVAVSLTENAAAYTAQVAYIAESASRRSLRHEFVDPVASFDPTGVELRNDKARRAADAAEFGRKAYETLEPGLGIESFERALNNYEESAIWENMKGLSRAFVLRILVKWSEDPAAARRDLQRLLAVDPRAEFPADLAPPDLLAEVERAREARAGEPKFSIDVNTAPVAARIYVDGTYRGTAPASVRGLVGGDHYVSLVAPGYAVVQRKIAASPGATATVTLVPAERARPFLVFHDRIRRTFLEPEEVPAAQVLARAAMADEVLVAGVRRSNGRLRIDMHRVAARDGHVLAVQALDVAETDPQLAQRIDGLALKLLADDRPRGSSGEPQGFRSELETAVKRAFEIPEDKIKLGVGIGGATLLATGAVLTALALNTAGEFSRMPQTNERVRELSESGRGQSIAADVCVALGLVAGGTWAWLEFGKPFAKKTDIEAPPVLEQKREEKKKKDRSDEWDPFARSPAPSWQPFAAVGAAGATFGLEGTF